MENYFTVLKQVHTNFNKRTGYDVLDSNLIIPSWVMRATIMWTEGCLLWYPAIYLLWLLSSVVFSNTSEYWYLQLPILMIFSVELLLFEKRNSGNKLWFGVLWLRAFLCAIANPYIVDCIFFSVSLLLQKTSPESDFRYFLEFFVPFNGLHLLIGLTSFALQFFFSVKLIVSSCLFCCFLLSLRFKYLHDLKQVSFEHLRKQTKSQIVIVLDKLIIPLDAGQIKIENISATGNYELILPNRIAVDNFGDNARIVLTCDRIISRKLRVSFDILVLKNEYECSYCFETLPGDHEFELRCGHSSCYDCLTRSLEISLSDGAVPCCFAKGCKEKLSMSDVTLISSDQVANKPNITEKYKHMMIHSATIACPNPNCYNRFAKSLVEGKGKKQSCPICNTLFCGSCFGTYHYHGDCTDILKIKYIWNQWVLHSLVKRNDESLENRITEIRNCQQVIRDDEIWKKERVRHCPNCKRYIDKIDGCNSMICGRNTEGGNEQMGCGTAFQWNDAKSYCSFIHCESVRNPLKQSETNHNASCAYCKQNIVGLLFCCVDCEDHKPFCQSCLSPKLIDSKHTFLVKS